ncbi:hypothetical protein B0H14DRAFT_3450769 [Mycena olivaceomarginata]|nr:hypothetical protein B0H14DRAFT_3450769 [Mycena olivaceomarginata]
MSSKRGRKRNDNLLPNSARNNQRAFRARRAAHLEALQQRISELEEENGRLRQALNLPPANRPLMGTGPTGRDKPKFPVAAALSSALEEEPAHTRKLGIQNIANALTEAIAGHVNPATTTALPPADPALKATTQAPIALGVWVEKAHDRVRLIDQLIFARDRNLRLLDLTIVTPSIGGGSIGAERALKAVASLFMWTDDMFGRALQQATYAHDQRTLDERRLALSETIDVVYNEASKQSVVYVKPCTANAATEMNPDSGLPGPRCVTCKNDDHLEPACSIIHCPSWWGPDTRIKYAREGQFATSTSIANANAQASTNNNVNVAPTDRGRGQSRARGGNR